MTVTKVFKMAVMLLVPSRWAGQLTHRRAGRPHRRPEPAVDGPWTMPRKLGRHVTLSGAISLRMGVGSDAIRASIPYSHRTI